MTKESILNEVQNIVNKTAQYIKSQRGTVASTDIEEKELNSLVSYVDKEAEKILVKGLSKLLPEAGFITEEDTVEDHEKAYTWIIDPLDGTTNFLYGIPYFSVSVALQHQGETILGIVHEINQDEQFAAELGKGATLNGQPISVIQHRKPNEVLVATGFPYKNDDNVDDVLATLKNFRLCARGIRRLGSAATDLCYVACGRLGGYYETTLNAWDVAAGALIVQEAGGKVTDFSGGSNFIFGGEILAASPQCHKEFKECLHPLSKS